MAYASVPVSKFLSCLHSCSDCTPGCTGLLRWNNSFPIQVYFDHAIFITAIKAQTRHKLIPDSRYIAVTDLTLCFGYRYHDIIWTLDWKYMEHSGLMEMYYGSLGVKSVNYQSRQWKPAWLVQFQREAKTLWEPFIWYFELRICGCGHVEVNNWLQLAREKIH